MKHLLIALLVLLPGLALASDGYGYPADRPWAQMRAGPDGGHVLTWEVSDDADGWTVRSRGANVLSAGYLDPGTLEATTLPVAAYAPGDLLEVCASWRTTPPAVQCFDVSRGFTVWLAVLHR
jgi:hypothetical protein